MITRYNTLSVARLFHAVFTALFIGLTYLNLPMDQAVGAFDFRSMKGIRSRVSVMSFALMNECYAALFSESSIFDSYMQIIFTESQNGEGCYSQ